MIRVEHRTHVFDRYNWDEGKAVTIAGQVITDELLQELHESGLAQEYDINGSSETVAVEFSPTSSTRWRRPSRTPAGTAGAATRPGTATTRALIGTPDDRAVAGDQRSARRWCALVVPAAVALLLVVACDVSGAGSGRAAGDRTVAVDRSGQDQPDVTDQELADLRDYGELEVPDTATNVDIETDSGLDFTVYARWSMPRDQVQAFLDQHGLNMREGFDAVGFTPSWGRPAADFDTYLGVEDRTGRGFRQVLVGLDDADQAAVFVKAGSL